MGRIPRSTSRGGLAGGVVGARSPYADVDASTVPSSRPSPSPSSNDDGGTIDVGRAIVEDIGTPEGYFMPPEWSEQAAVWMAWPYLASVWSRDCEPARAAVVDLISVMARYQTVKLLVRPEDLSDARRRLPAEWNVMPVCASYDDIWVRDTGPTFLLRGEGNEDGGGGIVDRGGLLAVRWTFNGWGWKHERVEKDRTVAGQIAPTAAGEEQRRASFVVRSSSRVGASTPTGTGHSSPRRSASSIPIVDQSSTPMGMDTKTKTKVEQAPSMGAERGGRKRR